MKWVELSVQAHPEAVDAIANVFQEHGTGGVAIEQPIRSDDEGEHEPVFEGLPTIRAYLPLTPYTAERERRIESTLWHLQAFDLSPIGPMKRREVEEEDWANAWKEHFHPLKIGNVVIKPTWREWESSPDEIVIELDPGMAFGTGLHPTTKLTLLALQRHVRREMDVLDLGTGSGILAIPAARRGAHVSALDVSEVAVEVAQTNIDTNGVGDRITVSQGSIDAIEGRRFDLILANIIASVLIALAPQLAAALKPGGLLLASGIIDERVEAVREALAGAGLLIVEQEHEGDWWLLVARRTG
ncbi:MAG TPA: 50S ribosomal protein L11 methyltransferase [Chloroflexota bacterium]